MSRTFIGLILALSIALGGARSAVAGWGEPGFEAYSQSDYALAAKLWTPFEAQAEADVLTRIGWMYKFGEGLDVDLQQATIYFRKAAELGDPWAMFSLGYVYHFGEGNVEEDLVAALEWYTLALLGGYERTQTRIDQVSAKMTPEQIALAKQRAADSPFKPRAADDQIMAGSLRDAKEMFQQEYMRARNKEIGERAISGEGEEARTFGDMFAGFYQLMIDMPDYMVGVFDSNKGGRQWSTVPKNVTKKAPENTSIADYYVFGEKLEARYVKAAANFEKAAQRGDAAAAANLGYLYFFGNGVELDILKARMWFEIAQRGGIKRAKTLVLEVNDRMTPDQIAEAEKMADEWSASISMAAEQEAP
jgi:uncharacterized protein